MKPRIIALATVALLAVSCADREVHEQASAFDGALRFELQGHASRAVADGEKVRWNIAGSDVRVTAQRIPIAWNGPARTLETVAAAMRQRYQLGEVIGELQARPSSVGDRSAIAFDGWIAERDQSRRTARKGILVADHQYIYLVDVIAGESSGETSIDNQMSLMVSTLHVVDREP